MDPLNRLALASLAVAMTAVLASCGGGGGSHDSDVVPASCSGAAVVATIDAAAFVGMTASASVTGCPSVSSIHWTQTSGASVALLSADDQVISFEPSQAGRYAFRADWRDATGTAGSSEVAVTAAAAVTTGAITVRADQSVRPGMTATVRAWPTLAAGDSVKSVAWSALDGATAGAPLADPLAYAVLAPSVDRDTPMRYRATLTTANGIVATDDVTVMVERLPATPDDQLIGNDIERTHAYRRASPYAAVLARCSYDPALRYRNSGDNNLCPSSQLPLLGTDPSIDAIMDRVLVTHDWMGDVFEQYLRNQDTTGDLRRMLGAVSAVVIGAHVRPAFYYQVTGAIYLDAESFWLSAEQRDTVSESADPRSNLDALLKYSRLYRYVRGDQYAALGFAKTVRATRSLPQLVPLLGPLLYHELTHAGDFFPPESRTLDPALSIFANLQPRLSGQQLTSDALASSHPLQSSELVSLATVKYIGGVTASAQQQAYSPIDIGQLFAADRASDDYAYVTFPNNRPREDPAMLVEEFMMQSRHGIRRDIGFTQHAEATSTGDTLIVGWGERGRIADAAVSQRLRLVVSRVLPWVDLAAIDALPPSKPMTPGVSWNANLALGDGLSISSATLQRSSMSAATLRSVQDDAGAPAALVTPRVPLN
ncbi:hypothetical protein BH09PSE6_BH09PSE6_19360 [soil metagenome]